MTKASSKTETDEQGRNLNPRRVHRLVEWIAVVVLVVALWWLLQNHPPRGPISTALLNRSLWILVLLVSLFHLLQFTQIISRWMVISSLPLRLSPTFLAAEGLAWFIAGLILFRGVWKGRNRARIIGKLLCLIYCLEKWGIMIWATPRAELVQRWPADLFITLAGLGLAYLALNGPASQLYFKENPVRIP